MFLLSLLRLQRMADEETAAQVHPEKLTNALLNAAKEGGAQLSMGTAEGITSDNAGRVTGWFLPSFCSCKTCFSESCSASDLVTDDCLAFRRLVVLFSFTWLLRGP